tara:strand:- start:202 stop:387 length:186 start_codon:yes stop_codon:yes gene_type:complete
MSIFNRDKSEKRKERRDGRREFRLSRIKEKAALLLAKGNRWKWLAVVIGLGLIVYLVFKFV